MIISNDLNDGKLLFTKKVGKLTVNVFEMNQPSEEAMKKFNKRINEFAAKLSAERSASEKLKTTTL